MSIESDKSVPRKKGKHIRVPVLPDEHAIITSNAESAGLSTAEFLRQIGMGYEVKGIVDLKQVLEMAKVNGDLGRLGGLLKLWLTKDPRMDGIDPQLLLRLVNKIEGTRSELREKMTFIIKNADLIGDDMNYSMKYMMMLPRILAAKISIIISFLALMICTPANAGIPVIDGTNVIQTTISAINDVASVQKQVQQYTTQLQQYENMLKNTVVLVVYI